MSSDELHGKEKELLEIFWQHEKERKVLESLLQHDKEKELLDPPSQRDKEEEPLGSRRQHENQNKLLESLRHTDPLIEAIVETAKDVSVHFLEEGEMGSGWMRANIEGPMYLLRRRQAPEYQLFIESTFCFGDLVDGLERVWELESYEKWIVYALGDPAERTRGIMFRDDAERKKMEIALGKTLAELNRESFTLQASHPEAMDSWPQAPAPAKEPVFIDGEKQVIVAIPHLPNCAPMSRSAHGDNIILATLVAPDSALT